MLHRATWQHYLRRRAKRTEAAAARWRAEAREQGSASMLLAPRTTRPLPSCNRRSGLKVLDQAAARLDQLVHDFGDERRNSTA